MNKNVKTILIVGGIALALLMAVPLLWGSLSGWQYGGWGMMGPWMMGGFGWGWFMLIFMIVFWVLVIWAVVALVRGGIQPSSPDSGSSRPESALEVLKRRYARGEIDKQEYEEKKKDLV
jgi:putative membrane protein